MRLLSQSRPRQVVRRALCLLTATSVITLSSASANAQASHVYRLIRRMAPGATAAEINAAETVTTTLNASFRDYRDQQINYPALLDAEATVGALWPLALQTPHELFVATGSGGSTTPVKARNQVRRARLTRLLLSDQSFYEVMVGFWFNHFHVDQLKRWGEINTADYNTQVCRTAPLGTFRNMVQKSSGWDTGGPTGMLTYLDNYASECDLTVTPQILPNENYARELLELHILGTEPQVYTSENIKDLAKILSGWGIDIRLIVPTPTNPNEPNPDFFRFSYNLPDSCDAGSLNNPVYPWLGGTLVGFDPANGVQAGRDAITSAIDYQDPVHGHVCAEFIARKLIEFLLYDGSFGQPDATQKAMLIAAQTNAVAAFGQDGNIEAMVKAILTIGNINELMKPSNPLYKYMTPQKFMTSVLRAVSPSITQLGFAELDTFLKDKFAHAPFRFGPPVGYPEDIGVWVQNQPARWDFAYGLFEFDGSVHGKAGSYTVDVDQLYDSVNPGVGFDLAIAGEQANQILTGGNLHPQDVVALQDYADDLAQNSAPPSEIRWKVLALACLAPSFNLY